MRKCSECSKQCNNCKQPLNLLAIKLKTFAYCLQSKHYLIQSQNVRVFFLVDFVQVYYETFFGRNLCFTLLQQWFIILLHKSNLIAIQMLKNYVEQQLLWQYPVFFLAMLEGSRLEFYFNWAAPGIFLKLLTKENLLGCFH